MDTFTCFLANGFSNSLLKFCSVCTEHAKHISENVIVAIHKCKISTEHQLYIKPYSFSVMEKCVCYGMRQKITLVPLYLAFWRCKTQYIANKWRINTFEIVKSAANKIKHNGKEWLMEVPISILEWLTIVAYLADNWAVRGQPWESQRPS